jgi:hypothetical protein
MNGGAHAHAPQAALSCSKLEVRGLRDRNVSVVMFVGLPPERATDPALKFCVDAERRG